MRHRLSLSLQSVLLVFLLVLASPRKAEAQLHSAYPILTRNTIQINFGWEVLIIDKDATLISFEDENGVLIQLWASATPVPGDAFAVDITNFRDAKVGGSPVDLLNGGGRVTPVPAGGKRTYSLVLKKLQLKGLGPPKPFSLAVDVGRVVEPQLKVTLNTDANVGNRREIVVRPQNIGITDVLNAIKNSPGEVQIKYEFAADDPAINYETAAESVTGDAIDPAGNPRVISIRPKTSLPRRPKKYTVKVLIPKKLLSGISGVDLAAEDEFIRGAATAEFNPPKLDRASSEFYFEAGFSSVGKVGQTTRTNVGNFSLHLKPNVPLLTRNVDGTKDDQPTWVATRLLFDADVDTQPIRNSKSPNRITLGADVDWGRDFFIRGKRPILPQLIWTNGLRYDSDRDFKLQTVYWRTEVTPKFRNFQQSREYRLYKFTPTKEAKEPFVSTYYVRPSFGYELGSIVKRDARITQFPTDTISRFFVRWESGIEFKRLLTFSVEDTYLYLQNATNRRHRNYVEARLEFNTGPLLTLDLGSLNNAIVFKYQNGEQPPSFGRVDAFSMGFKIYH